LYQGDLLGFICLFVLLLLSAAGGIAGGGAIIPTLLIVFQFKSTYAIALGNFITFTSAFTRFII